MNRLLQLIDELGNMNERLDELEKNYVNKGKGDIFHKIKQHHKKKKAQIEKKIINFGNAYPVNLYQGKLNINGKTRKFKTILVDTDEDEARSVIELHTKGKVIEMTISKVKLLNLELT